MRGISPKAEMAPQSVILHAYWQSSCAWRERAALRWKGIPHQEKHYDIFRMEHITDQFRGVNPAQRVPALEIDGLKIIESMAILHYLEDTRAQPSLLPTSPIVRARILEICEVIVSGIQPLQNIPLKDQTEEEFERMALHYTRRGLETLQDLLTKSSQGEYCVGDQLSMADLCLVPQVYNAVIRRKLDISKYPLLDKLYNKLLQEDVFKSTYPDLFKPDC